MTTPYRADTPLYNSRIIHSFILLIKHKYSYVDIGELLDCAGMKEYEVADQAHWFTQEQVDRFYEKLVQMTGNAKIAREAGRYAASPDVLGAMRQYILGMVDAANTFEIISKATGNLTRSSSYESRRVASNTVEIVVTPLQPGVEKPYQCENRIGFFEAIVLIFNHKITDLQYFPDIRQLPSIEHPECVFQGGSVCRYRISWDKAFAQNLRKARNLVILMLAGLNVSVALLGPHGALPLIFLGSVVLVQMLELAAGTSEKRALKEGLTSTKESIDNLLDQIDLNFNSALLTHEIGHRLGSFHRVEEMLPEVTRIMQQRLSYDRALILLADPERTHLEVGSWYGYSDEELDCLTSRRWPLTGEPGPDVYLATFLEQRPFLVNDLDKARGVQGMQELACSKATGTRAFICCPIVSETLSLGVLAVESVRTRRPLVERDLSLIMGLAAFIGISLRNCELIGALENANRDLEMRVQERTADLAQSQAKLKFQHEELERTYFELEEETAQRVATLEQLREKERMLLQQSRLAALGEMISNIAHQWRQPLNELGLIVQEIPVMYDRGNFDRDYLRGSVAKFMKVLSHMSKTIDDFRNFFRPGKEKVNFAVSDVVHSTLSLIQESFRQLQITVEVQAEANPTIFGHPNEFSQVIINLLFNARDAFVAQQHPGPRSIVIRILAQNGKAVVTVTDNAGGIPEEILERIFDPYFTTRGPEQGTGIGLYMSKLIIEKNIPGRLSVRNVGQGAEFRIEV
jgi:two-component system, NtrC family, C4-dicarboxylate transport sensor histidine kinase DctB